MKIWFSEMQEFLNRIKKGILLHKTEADNQWVGTGFCKVNISAISFKKAVYWKKRTQISPEDTSEERKGDKNYREGSSIFQNNFLKNQQKYIVRESKQIFTYFSQISLK